MLGSAGNEALQTLAVMDRDMQLRHLAEAERHVAEGVRHIAEQEVRIAELDRDGRDTTQARRLLNNFRTVQAQHVVHRDFILGQCQE